MSNEIREQVSRTYANAIKSGTGCCAPSCCDDKAKPSTAESLGYSPDELATLPEDAVANSFGCGNPLAFSGVREGQVVVDLGSGAGIDVLIAAEKVGPAGRAIGIDMTDEMIERARANIARAQVQNAEIRKGIIEELPLDDESADWIISNCVINLSPEKPRVFAEISRVLRPEGRFSISDIVVADLPDWVLQSMALYGACVAGAISEDDYLEGLRAAGLEDVRVVDRLVYDSDMLRGLIDSGDIPLPQGLSPDFVDKAVAALTGKVQSVKVTGRKPS